MVYGDKLADAEAAIRELSAESIRNSTRVDALKAQLAEAKALLREVVIHRGSLHGYGGHAAAVPGDWASRRAALLGEDTSQP